MNATFGIEPSSLLTLEPLPLPLRKDEGGVVRVGAGRVSLDLIVEQYENGMTPEEMVRAYETLDLADVHIVIGYYLRHADKVRAYLMRRQTEADSLRTKVENEHAPISRQALMKRRVKPEIADAPTGD